MIFGVLRFPGSCDEVDAQLACERVGDARIIWHADESLGDVDAVVIPGGFSYGDYLRVGAIARFAPAMERVREFADAGGPVLGICNGFQVLCEAGMLPGALLPNEGLRFICRQVDVEVVATGTVWTAACASRERLSIPVKHTTGGTSRRRVCRANRCRGPGRAALRGRSEPDGSLGTSRVSQRAGNVLGLMPHPEHAVDPRTGSVDGLRLLESAAGALART